MKLSDLEDAFTFVSHGMYGDHSAMACKSTGQICWCSEAADMDEIPEEAYESDDWVEIPHRNDLNLGRDLVFEFVARRMPSEQGRVESIFRRRGAYGRYKGFLERQGLLQEWYDFENERVRQAILDWCRENGIEVSG